MFGGKALLSDAAIAAGGILGGSAIGAKSQQETNELMMTMSNTQYQRAMADMEAAGLNPMLAADKGGAGTPQLTAPAKGQGLGSAARTITMDLPQSQAQVAESNTRQGLNKKEEELKEEQKKQTQAMTELTRTNRTIAAHSARSAKANADREVVVNAPFTLAAKSGGVEEYANKGPKDYRKDNPDDWYLGKNIKKGWNWMTSSDAEATHGRKASSGGANSAKTAARSSGKYGRG